MGGGGNVNEFGTLCKSVICSPDSGTEGAFSCSLVTPGERATSIWHGARNHGYTKSGLDYIPYITSFFVVVAG